MHVSYLISFTWTIIHLSNTIDVPKLRGVFGQIEDESVDEPAADNTISEHTSLHSAVDTQKNQLPPFDLRNRLEEDTSDQNSSAVINNRLVIPLRSDFPGKGGHVNDSNPNNPVENDNHTLELFKDPRNAEHRLLEYKNVKAGNSKLINSHGKGVSLVIDSDLGTSTIGLNDESLGSSFVHGKRKKLVNYSNQNTFKPKNDGSKVTISDSYRTIARTPIPKPSNITVVQNRHGSYRLIPRKPLDNSTDSLMKSRTHLSDISEQLMLTKTNKPNTDRWKVNGKGDLLPEKKGTGRKNTTNGVKRTDKPNLFIIPSIIDYIYQTKLPDISKRIKSESNPSNKVDLLLKKNFTKFIDQITHHLLENNLRWDLPHQSKRQSTAVYSTAKKLKSYDKDLEMYSQRINNSVKRLNDVRTPKPNYVQFGKFQSTFINSDNYTMSLKNLLKNFLNTSMSKNNLMSAQIDSLKKNLMDELFKSYDILNNKTRSKLVNGTNRFDSKFRSLNGSVRSMSCKGFNDFADRLQLNKIMDGNSSETILNTLEKAFMGMYQKKLGPNKRLLNTLNKLVMQNLSDGSSFTLPEALNIMIDINVNKSASIDSSKNPTVKYSVRFIGATTPIDGKSSENNQEPFITSASERSMESNESEQPTKSLEADITCGTSPGPIQSSTYPTLGTSALNCSITSSGNSLIPGSSQPEVEAQSTQMVENSVTQGGPPEPSEVPTKNPDKPSIITCTSSGTSESGGPALCSGEVTDLTSESQAKTDAQSESTRCNDITTELVVTNKKAEIRIETTVVTVQEETAECNTDVPGSQGTMDSQVSLPPKIALNSLPRVTKSLHNGVYARPKATNDAKRSGMYLIKSKETSDFHERSTKVNPKVVKVIGNEKYISKVIRALNSGRLSELIVNLNIDDSINLNGSIKCKYLNKDKK